MRKIQLLLLLIMAGLLTTNAQNEVITGQNEKDLFFTKQVKGTMEEVYHKVVEALKVGKFGVITEIDMAKTLNEKLGVEMKPYKILGVCNPGYAYEAIKAEPNIGVFLPCKVILKQLDENTIEVVSVDPEKMMKMLGNEKLDETAKSVGKELEKVILGL
jgi:uncharacterized protein (DUF302 family)